MSSVLLLMINCIITLSLWLWNHEPQASGSAADFDETDLLSIRVQTMLDHIRFVKFQPLQKLHIICIN